MKGKTVIIEFKKKAVLNDVCAECNLLGRTLGRTKEMEELAADIMTPAETATKPIVARAMTEGLGMVKTVCQSYLTMGRDKDDNRLEALSDRADATYAITASPNGGVLSLELQKGITYEFRLDSAAEACYVEVQTATENKVVAKVGSVNGKFEYTPTETGRLKFVTLQETTINVRVLSGDFGSYELRLLMPEAFNLGMTSVVKDAAHRILVDHVMASLLKNQLPEKWQVYNAAVSSDADALRRALTSRLDFRRRSSDWD